VPAWPRTALVVGSSRLRAQRWFIDPCWCLSVVPGHFRLNVQSGPAIQHIQPTRSGLVDVGRCRGRQLPHGRRGPHGRRRVLRRPGGRGRPQRPGRRGLPGPCRRADARPGGPAGRRRSSHHRGALAGRPRVPRVPALLRGQPHPADHRPRPGPGAARLQGPSDGAELPGVPRRPLAHGRHRRSRSQPRAGQPVLARGRRGDAPLGRLAGRAGRGARAAADGHAAAAGLAPLLGPARHPRAGLAAPGGSGSARSAT
jgi:hypothetical protein